MKIVILDLDSIGHDLDLSPVTELGENIRAFARGEREKT